MRKRAVLGVVVVATGLLLCSAPATLPVGVLMLAGGAYVLALPHVAGSDAAIERRGEHNRT